MNNLSRQLSKKRDRFRVEIRRSENKNFFQQRRHVLQSEGAIGLFNESMQGNFERAVGNELIFEVPAKKLVDSKADFQKRMLSKISEFNPQDIELLTAYQFKTGLVLTEILHQLLNQLENRPIQGKSNNYIEKCIVYFAITSQILGDKQTLRQKVIQMYNIFIIWWNQGIELKRSSLVFYATGAFSQLSTDQTVSSDLMEVLMEIIRISDSVLQANLLMVISNITNELNHATDVLIQNQDCINKIFSNLPQHPRTVISIIQNLSYSLDYVMAMLKTPVDWLASLESFIPNATLFKAILFILTNLVIDEDSCTEILKHKGIIKAIVDSPSFVNNKDSINELFLKFVTYSAEQQRQKLLSTYDVLDKTLKQTEWKQQKSWLMRSLLETLLVIKHSTRIPLSHVYLQQFRKVLESEYWASQQSFHQMLDQLQLEPKD